MAKLKQLNRDAKREFLRQQRDQIDSELAEPVELTKKDLNELLVNYEKRLKEENFSENTIIKYVRNAKWFVDHFSSENAILEKSDVNEFRKLVTKKYTSVKTINSYIVTINRFLHFCDLGEFTIKKEKEQSENIIKDRIYEYEYKRMLRKSKELGWMDLHYLIRVMGETGIRVSERKFLTVRSIHSSSLDFMVDNKNKWRTVPIPQELARDLRKYVKTKGIKEGMIFDMDYRYDIYNKLKSLAGKCKINKKKVTPHAFRHYFGFRYVQVNGEAGITQLSDIMGHSSVETTRVYTRGTSKDYRNAMERMV